MAVKDLDLEIEEQSIYSVIGPNGAGKTTFFNCVTGFYKPDGGDILFQGQSIAGLSPDQITKLGIARTYQNIRLFSNMTALENVLVGQNIHLSSGLLGSIFHTKAMRAEEADAVAEAKRLLQFVARSEERRVGKECD